MTDRLELADFLRRRRESLRPDAVGLGGGARRRTPGLRREEVAMLAGVSVDYYARLEQSRGATPSASVVTAVARALQCDRDERDHLLHLAGHPVPRRGGDGHIRPGLIAVADRLVDVPAVIITDLGEVVWQNHMGRALFADLPVGPGRDRNLIWRWFDDPQSRPMPQEDWDRISAAHVSDLRATFARRSGDRQVREFVADLIDLSSEFAQLWERHDVAIRRTDVKNFIHKDIGLLEFRCEVLLTPDDDISLLVFFPLEGTETADKLALLGVVGTQSLTSG
ncbi:helix-turn-helix transcriptional regulator [Brevibacterium oceani]|uniref:helix-turn-helix transcriptional regulator n=1 Tax=Brevibacterium oceani TaxID=358099 RepID=UPI0015E6BEB1|nr:helix-turn-helix transcriptional regulator [Brevibacterium oceani]